MNKQRRKKPLAVMPALEREPILTAQPKVNEGTSMSELTKLFHHTGATTPTDIGPATGGVLHSIYIDSAAGGGDVTLKDGGSAGTIIFQGRANELKWQGVKLDGQLNIALGNASQRITVEMSELL
jgi:hypothetical protein